MNLINCDKVEVKKGELGLSVFAREDIKAGVTIETGLMIPLKNVSGEDNPHLHTWSDDRETWACSSGVLAYYNHSETPNAKKYGDLKENTIKVVALSDIKAGDEIRTKYMSKSWRKCFSTF
tara:strand:- start:446 stop:808 length:363 start_codon:yes stop_codon:yes gene_type:complete